MSAHEYCPGHGDFSPSGTSADIRVIECPECMGEKCNGICLTGDEIGIFGNPHVAVPHPACPLHSHLATHDIDGTPR